MSPSPEASRINGRKSNGRPSKLTPELQEKLLDAIEIGMTIERSCEYACINKTVFYDWIKKGKKQIKGKYRTFIDALEQADSQAEINLLQAIQDDGGWKGKCWILERRFKERWAKEDRLKIDNKINLRKQLLDESDLDLENMSLEEIETIEAIYERHRKS